MNDWMSPAAFIQTLARVALVWLAFYGAGKLLRKPLRIDRSFPLLPSEVVGMVAFVFLTIPLTLLGIMNRSVCPVFLFIFAVPGVLLAYGKVRDLLPGFKLKLIQILPVLFLIFVLILNFTHASMPNLAFDDPLITYAVQPDRWLNSGGIYWLEETAFSGFPLLYEMTAVWPASMSSDRMNQLSVLQVFQMSLLVLAVFRGLSFLKVRKDLWTSAAIIILFCSAMYLWCSKAKTDTLAILFCTLALAAAVRQRDGDFRGSPLTSWLCMGMALATKQTAIVVLVPFLLYSGAGFFRYSTKWKILAVAAFLAFPSAYAIRTMLKTGSPTYPVHTVNFMVREGWELQDPEENLMVNNRASQLYESKFFSPLKHVGVFFAFMEGCFLLLLAGIIASAAGRRWKDAALSVPVLVYCAAAILVFWPPWWGSKYSILLYPFAAILGARLFQFSRHRAFLAAAVMIPSFIVPGFIGVAGYGRHFNYRMAVLDAVVLRGWNSDSEYGKTMLSTPEEMTYMWANSVLDEGTVIFSIGEEKRYFFDGTVIVGWRHPLGQRLYVQNNLEEETAILDSLGVDFVGFYRIDPAVLDQEKHLEILDHIGIGEILEPVISNGGYLLCRYNGN